MHFSGQLSSAVTAVVDPSKLTWVDDATFVLAARGARHEILPDHYADRLSSSYDDVLHDDAGSTRRVLTGQLKVRAPLVGGRRREGDRLGTAGVRRGRGRPREPVVVALAATQSAEPS